MTALLLGPGGYVGSQFVRELTAREMPFTPLRRKDYTSFAEFHKRLIVDKPSLVINAAAYVAAGGMDFNELDKPQTIEANLMLPAMLANACELADVPLLHLSTGCLYNGDNGGKGWSEIDPPQLSFRVPCGTYVGCKQLAEEIVGRYSKAYICRIRLPFDEFDHPRNLLTKLQTFSKVCDEIQSLSHRGDAVKACLDLWQMRADYGVYNCVNPGAARYWDICDKLRDKIWHNRRGFNFVTPEWFDDNMARTPKSRCVLNTQKLLDAGVKMRPVGEAITDAIENWTTQ